MSAGPTLPFISPLSLTQRSETELLRRAFRVNDIIFHSNSTGELYTASSRFATKFYDDPPLNFPLDAPALIDVNHYIIGDIQSLGIGDKFPPNVVLAGHLYYKGAQERPTENETFPLKCNTKYVFSIQTHDMGGAPLNHNRAKFKARLYGSTIVSCEEPLSVGRGRYEISFLVRDPGEYILEVYCYSVEGEGSAPSFINYKIPFIMYQLIFRSEHVLKFAEFVSTNKSSLSHCKSLSVDLPGRWVYLFDDKCRVPFCTGNSLNESQISDKLGLNVQYIWSPYECYYHLYSSSELLQCALSCGYKTWHFEGDSVGRELLQNIVMLFFNFNPSASMPKLKFYDESSIKFVVKGHTFRIFWGPENFKKNADISVSHFANAWRIFQNRNISETIESYKAYLKNLFVHCTKANKICYHYINPSVQSEAIQSKNRLDFNPHKNFYPHITRSRMKELNLAGRKQARGLRLPVVDGEIITEGHWYGSWDGLHYSEMARHYNATDVRWFGGVSMMITQAFINSLCNKQCNPGFFSERNEHFEK